MDKNNIPTKLLPPNFPELLTLIKNPPQELYCLGNIPKGFYIALVGTRRPGNYSKELCKRLVKSLQNTQAIVVSGLAQGIDCYCHEAAIDFGVPTIAVLAQGLMTKIHGERRILAEQILQNGGAIISELPLETPSYKSMFPARNRIIAGISNAVVIVESKEKGGSMLTANFALQYNRPLFALSGNCFQETYQGPLTLLRSDKAKPIYFPEDLPFICNIPVKDSNKAPLNISISNLSLEAQELFKKNSGFFKNLSELSSDSKMVMSSLFSILTELELAGLVSSQDGYRYFFEKECSCKN